MTGRRCSMGSTLGGPWHCGDGRCMGREPDCGAAARNLREELAMADAQVWLRRPEQRWESAWREEYGMPPLGIADSPQARILDRQIRYGREGA